MTARAFLISFLLFRTNLFSPLGSRTRLIVLRHPNKLVSHFIITSFLRVGKSGVGNHKTRQRKSSSLNAIYQSHYLGLPLTVSRVILRRNSREHQYLVDDHPSLTVYHPKTTNKERKECLLRIRIFFFPSSAATGCSLIIHCFITI